MLLCYCEETVARGEGLLKLEGHSALASHMYPLWSRSECVGQSPLECVGQPPRGCRRKTGITNATSRSPTWKSK